MGEGGEGGCEEGWVNEREREGERERVGEERGAGSEHGKKESRKYQL